MDLRPYVETIHAQLDAAADAGGEEAGELARRLAAPLDSAILLALQDALAAAAEEITVELAPGSVELRIRGREPGFVVTPPPEGASGGDDDDEPPGGWVAPDQARTGDEGPTSRISLRVPEYLKAQIERAAESEGLSVNSWLVRVAAGRVERGETVRGRERRVTQGARRYKGWAR